MNDVRNGIIGIAIGDALGVPVEFESRESLERNPVTNMRAYGTHEQSLGTWSDDTSLTLCLAESLLHGYDIERIARSFLDWKLKGLWTAHGKIFDIGVQTHNSLNDIYRILESGDCESLRFLKYEAKESSNGNGSLMRILPMYFFLKDKGLENNFDIIWEVSALTHQHMRAAISCLLYLVMIDELIKNDNIQDAYLRVKERMTAFFENHHDILHDEKQYFERIIEIDISTLAQNEINSDGYVINTLEATFWCLMTTSSYKDAVLKAVNLGWDTDTTGAIVGGLAGIFYGIDTAPSEWYENIARIREIEALCDELHANL